MAETELLAALHKIELLADLPEEILFWLIEHGEEKRYATGDILFEEGTPAEVMMITLEGEFHERQATQRLNESIFIGRAGMISGMLPYSRMTHFTRTSRAVTPGWQLHISTRHFPEMIQRFPC